MTNKKRTSPRSASKASSILSSNTSSDKEKSIAGSVLAQARNNKETTQQLASRASRILSSSSSTSAQKSLAASDLAQARKNSH